MKVLISSTGEHLESKMDQRFGRAAYFVLIDTETMQSETISNQASATAGGAGITSAQNAIDKGCEVVITGNVGPNAMNVLIAAGIKIYKGVVDSINVNVEMFKNGKLEKIENPVQSHYGMNSKS